MVEFTLILPVLMLLILGLADVARAVYDYNIISNSAREGAREAILAYNQCSNTANLTPCVGTGPPADAGSSIVGVDNAVNRAGAGIVAYQFASDTIVPVGPPGRSSAPCTPAPNQGCVWIFNANKQGGHNVVVEIEFKFQPLTALVANVLGNSSIFWAKSEMKTEY
jgi:hypothetical protein